MTHLQLDKIQQTDCVANSFALATICVCMLATVGEVKAQADLDECNSIRRQIFQLIRDRDASGASSMSDKYDARCSSTNTYPLHAPSFRKRIADIVSNAPPDPAIALIEKNYQAEVKRIQESIADDQRQNAANQAFLADARQQDRAAAAAVFGQFNTALTGIQALNQNAPPQRNVDIAARPSNQAGQALTPQQSALQSQPSASTGDANGFALDAPATQCLNVEHVIANKYPGLKFTNKCSEGIRVKYWDKENPRGGAYEISMNAGETTLERPEKYKAYEWVACRKSRDGRPIQIERFGPNQGCQILNGSTVRN